MGFRDVNFQGFFIDNFGKRSILHNPMATTKKNTKAAPKKTVKKATPKKAVKKTVKKVAVKKATPKKAVKKTVKKVTVKKTTAKKAVKKTVKKAAPKKAVKKTIKKTTAKKAVKKTVKKRVAKPTGRAAFKREMRKNLIKEKAVLLTEINEKVRHESEEGKFEIGDIYDIASNERERELTLMLGDRERAKIQEIDDALERLNDKYYGVCEECEEPIGQERLRALLFTTVCIECKSNNEQASRFKGKFGEELPVKILEKPYEDES